MNNKLNETMERLDRAYTLLGKIPVSGDNVDRMAVVRQELRTAYAALHTETEATDGQTDRG